MIARSTGNWGRIAGTLAVALFAFGCSQTKKPAGPAMAWNTAMDAGLTDAAAHHRPILLDFYTDW
jgi:thiol:disulfide interchange protein